jgi:uncharacterized protein YjiS (DUF1127 family)
MGLSSPSFDAPFVSEMAMSFPLLPAFGRSARILVGRVLARHRSQVTYRELIALDDRQLADIGLARGEIAHVALIARRQPVRGGGIAGWPANLNRPYAA